MIGRIEPTVSRSWSSDGGRSVRNDRSKVMSGRLSRTSGTAIFFSAGLAATARQHLRLDDDGAAELLGRPARLLGRGREATLRDGDSEAPEELLPLVLVEVHGG